MEVNGLKVKNFCRTALILTLSNTPLLLRVFYFKYKNLLIHVKLKKFNTLMGIKTAQI